MKQVTYILMLALAFTGCKQQPEETFNEMEVKKVLEVQQEAWNRGDIEAFMDGYERSDSTRFISKKSITYGWKEVLSNYKKSYPDMAAMGKLNFVLSHVEKLGENTASVTGKWILTETDKEASGHFLLILRKTDKGWKIAVDCTS